MTLMNKYEFMAMAAGFLLGGLISSIITEKVVERRMNEEVNKEIDKLREQYAIQWHVSDDNAEKISEVVSNSGSVEPPKSKFSENSIDYHTVDTHQTQYNHEVAVKDENYVSKYGSYDAPIHMVSFEDGCNAPEGWRTECLKWYSQDDVLTDEDNNPVDFSLIGNATDNFDENIISLDETSVADDTIYVSNRNTMTIYEVQRIDANYYEEVMGGMVDWEDDRLSGGREKIHKRKGKFDD